MGITASIGAAAASAAAGLKASGAGGGPFTAPATGAAVITNSAAAQYTYGTWVQALAAAPADCVVTGIALANAPSSVTEGVIDVGVGAAASEVSIGETPIGEAASGDGIAIPCVPPLAVAAGQRIAVRSRDASGTTQQWNVLLQLTRVSDLVAYNA